MYFCLFVLFMNWNNVIQLFKGRNEKLPASSKPNFSTGKKMQPQEKTQETS